jgi:lambda family phage portal protein
VSRRLITRPQPQGPRKPIYSGVAGQIAKAVDTVVGTFAPRIVHEWRKARVRSAALVAYEAARINRTNPGARTSSADLETLNSLPELRARSREMVRDDAHAATVMRIHEECIVGEGIRAQATCTPETTGATQAECDRWNLEVDQAFAQWCDEADATEVGDFYELQSLMLRECLVNGDGLAQTVIDGDRLLVGLIDADRLESPSLIDTMTMRGGVELGARGQPVAYHVYDNHPDEVSFGGTHTIRRIPRFSGGLQVMCHFYRRDRAGGTRGVPLLTPALISTKQLHHYLDSELVAARAASNFALFISRTPQKEDAEFLPVQESEEAVGADYHEYLEPGTIQYLNEGEMPHAFNPNRPGTSFDPFVTRLLRAITASSGLSYEMVARDFARMNLSSARALLREMKRGFDLTRKRLVRAFCRPMRDNAVRWMVSQGIITPPTAWIDDPRPFLQCNWIAPVFGMVDPQTDTATAVARVHANLSDPYHEAAAQGRNAEEVLRARAAFLAKQRDIEQEFGLPAGSLNSGAVPIQQTAGTAPGLGGEDEDEQEDEDEDEAEQVDDQDQDDETEEPDQ